MEEERVLALVDSLYEAAVDPARYGVFLERLAEAVRGNWTLLMSHDRRAHRPSISLGIRIDPAAEAQYNAHYGQISPLATRIGPFLRPGVIVSGEEIIRESDLTRTAYYNEFCRPNDMHYKIGAIFAADPHGASMITVTRPRRTGPFDATVRRLLQLLIPHLQRVVEISRKLALSQAQSEALDRVPTGCVLLGSNGHLLFANRAAEQIFRRNDGIATLHGRLCSSSGAAGVQLRNLIRAVTADLFLPHSGGVVAIPRSGGRRPYSVLVASLRSAQLDWPIRYPVAAIVFISDPSSPGSSESVLQALYRFTPAEARLAAALARGQGLVRAAEELHITINTAKTQLRHIFAKSQTSRQAELVRLLATVVN